MALHFQGARDRTGCGNDGVATAQIAFWPEDDGGWAMVGINRVDRC